MADVVQTRPTHPDEPHDPTIHARLNWLRAGVLGANDGIVSTAGLVVGVAGATTSRLTILVAGIAGVVAGALSMAAGEYVSVSTQRDTEQALIEKESRELREEPAEELDELTVLYARKGLSPGLARQVAVELTEQDALAAHLEVELGIDPDDLTSPWHAAWASAGSFLLGAALPLLSATLVGSTWRVPFTFTVVVLALALTGLVSSRLGEAHSGRAVRRNVVGGVVAMAVTFGIGVSVGGLTG